MFNFHKNHRNLAGVAFVVFVILSLFVAVVPAYKLQDTEPLPAMRELTQQELRGLNVYVSENCMACHTQQVRNIEMDRVWGTRPSLPSDYFYSKARMDLWRQSPSLLGSERTGPDLTNIGSRQPGIEWHLMHLYNPRIVVKESVMPSYPWLFKQKAEEDLLPDDIVVAVPEDLLKNKEMKVVATKKAIDLVAYLQSLKQADLPDNTSVPFIGSSEPPVENTETVTSTIDGKRLFTMRCAACHQENGQGLAGAFPPLAGSKIVTNENPEQLIKIILQGYDARTEFGVMPGFAGQLTDEEVAAIATHERTSWGNKAPAVKPEDVKKIRDFVMTLNQ